MRLSTHWPPYRYTQEVNPIGHNSSYNNDILHMKFLEFSLCFHNSCEN